nr:glycosyltransferase family 4 protein [Candidatus Delongbacteria bacterium]
MKILIYSNMYPSKDFHYGGIFVKNQYEYLHNNFKDHVFEIKAMKRRNTNFFGSVFKYLHFMFSSIFLLFKYYDVLHIHYLSFHCIFGFIYKLFHPRSIIILTLHGSDVNMFPENILLRKTINLLLRFAKVTTICVGKKLANNFHNKFFLESNYNLPAGVNHEIFYYNKEVKKKYDFTFVGSFTKIKGIDLIIEAIKNFKLDYRWCFIGIGDYLDELRSISKEYNIKIYSGLDHVDIARKLNESRFFIIPSRSEGFPLASIEALYCGVPVLCSNLDQFKEQIKDGENGFIIENSTSKSVEDTIIKAYSLDEKEYSRL